MDGRAERGIAATYPRSAARNASDTRKEVTDVPRVMAPGKASTNAGVFSPPMRVVILDGSPIIIALLKKLISTLPGTRPLTFTSAIEALEWCADNEPHPRYRRAHP